MTNSKNRSELFGEVRIWYDRELLKLKELKIEKENQIRRDVPNSTVKADLLGRKFGRLTVVKDVGLIDKYSNGWLCECECGNKKRVRSRDLLKGATKSCGCLKSPWKKGIHSVNTKDIMSDDEVNL